MENIDHVTQLLRPFGPKLPVDQLIEEVNRLYHAFEAKSYDDSHPEIRAQLPGIWKSMLDIARSNLPQGPWRVLDFGCGTGFATEQVLDMIPPTQLESITCYDPSPEMLQRCQARLAGRFPDIRWTDQLANIGSQGERFDLLVTNSVLHHLSNPKKTLASLSELLSHDAIWLCGHEPSRRFYDNDSCSSLYKRFRRMTRLRQTMMPHMYVKAFARFFGIANDPGTKASRAAYAAGLFTRRPPRSLIARLVDFHVAHSKHEVECGRGFDLGHLERELRTGWGLEWHKTYNFLGADWQGAAPPRWQKACMQLERSYPEDGANFCSVWKRTSVAAKAAA